MAVMAVHSAPCGECWFCTTGRENLCEHTMDKKVLGAYAEYLKLPAAVVKKNLYLKPEHLSYAEAAMLEPLACVVHGLDVVKHGVYGNVLIIGAGTIGLLHLMLAKLIGKRVIVAGRGARRLEMARLLGADLVVDSELDGLAWSVIEATEGLGADLVIEATGTKAVWEATPRMVRKGGTVLLFGGCPPDTSACFDTARLHYDEISLVGAFHFTPRDVKDAFELLQKGRLDVGPLISGEYPLDELPAAFEALMSGQGIKYAIIP
jgi:L-iditol 2-dehydrogenase